MSALDPAAARALMEAGGGPEERIGANQPLLLDDPDTIRLVLEGAVDVFLVPVVGAEVVGTRRPLFRVPVGGALLGGAPVPLSGEEGAEGRAGEAVALLGVGLAGTRLGRLPLARYREQVEAGAPGSAEALSEWVGRLVGGVGELAQAPAPQPQTPAAAWRDPRAWEGLQALHRRCLAAAVGAERRLQRAEGEQVAARLEQRQRAFSEAMLSLATVLDPHLERLGGLESGDDLLAACQLVGRALGVEVRRPSAACRAGHEEALHSIARASRLPKREVRLEPGWWARDNGPLLGFLAEGHRPVALLPRPGRARGYDLVDPREGLPRPMDARQAEALEPRAWMFYRPLPERSLRLPDLLAFGLAHTWRDLAEMLWMGLLIGLLGLAVPIATGTLIGTILPSGLRSDLAAMTMALMAATLGSSVFSFVRTLAILRLEGRMDSELQAALMARLLQLPASFFRRYTAGDLSNRLLGIHAIRQNLTDSTLSTILGSLFSVFSLGLLFYYDLKLALVAVALVAVQFLMVTASTWLQLRSQRPILDLQGELTGLTVQLLGGIAKLRVAAAERAAFARWAARFSRQRQLQSDNQMVGIHFGALSVVYQSLTTTLLFACIAWTGYSGLDTASFMAFYSAFGQFSGALMSLSGVISSLVRVQPTLDRLRPLLTEPLEYDGEQPDPGLLKGHLRVTGLAFRYSREAPLALQDVHFEARPGEMVAIVGPSGAGKSTILRLLLGFDQPEHGQVFYDDQDLRDVDVRLVRRQVGVVLQSGRLMPGDIFTNIVGSSTLTMEDAWEAARRVGLDGRIRALPMQMHTFLSEGASTFSGGERQLLMLARAVVTRPRYLLLDEATSALDAEVQEQVTAGIAGLEATRVIIAHRLSTIRRADRIYVLSGGRIVQTGTYDQLLHQPGEFQELARRQLV